jgi:transcriptional regulator with XRE-family HTH domain
MGSQHRNRRAGELIKSLRMDQGLSPEALSFAIYKAGYGSVSARSIRRLEGEGVIPRVRSQFALAQFFDRPVTSIWQPQSTPATVAA